MSTARKFLISLALLSLVGLSAAPAFALADAPTGAQGLGDPTATQGLGNPTATQGNCDTVGSLTNPLGCQTNSVCLLLKALLNVAVLLGFPVATFFVVYAGFRLIVARGNPEELKAARKNLYYTIIGIAIFLGAWLLAQVIANTLTALGVSVLGSCK